MRASLCASLRSWAGFAFKRNSAWGGSNSLGSLRMGDSSSGLKARPHKAKAFRPWLARRQSCGLKGRSRCFILTGARDLSGRFQTAARGDRPEGLPFAHPGLQPGTLGGIPSPGGTKRWKPAVKPPDLRSPTPSAPAGAGEARATETRQVSRAPSGRIRCWLNRPVVPGADAPSTHRLPSFRPSGTWNCATRS